MKSEKYIIAVETPSARFKLFQIICGRDGSIFVPFPYFKHSSAQLIEKVISGGQKYPLDINVGGPLTMHHVKYTHHADGEAHFSQQGKILTKVRRRSNPLNVHEGHLFTVQLQGLSDFEQMKDNESKKGGRQIVSVRVDREPPSLKLVAHLYSVSELSKRMIAGTDQGPWIQVIRDGKPYIAAILAVGNNDPVSRILTLSFEEVPQVFPKQRSGFSFIGGFDAPTTAFNHEMDTSFLILLSPASENPSEIVRKYGSVDLR